MFLNCNKIQVLDDEGKGKPQSAVVKGVVGVVLGEICVQDRAELEQVLEKENLKISFTMLKIFGDGENLSLDCQTSFYHF